LPVEALYTGADRRTLGASINGGQCAGGTALEAVAARVLLGVAGGPGGEDAAHALVVDAAAAARGDRAQNAAAPRARRYGLIAGGQAGAATTVAPLKDAVGVGVAEAAHGRVGTGRTRALVGDRDTRAVCLAGVGVRHSIGAAHGLEDRGADAAASVTRAGATHACAADSLAAHACAADSLSAGAARAPGPLAAGAARACAADPVAAATGLIAAGSRSSRAVVTAVPSDRKRGDRPASQRQGSKSQRGDGDFDA